MAIVETTMVGEGIARVTLNDPDRYNALTPALIDGLTDAFASIRRDREIRVVILDGNGRGFCAGADMSATGGVPDRSRDRGPVGFVHEMQEHLMEVVLAIHEIPQPVIAALNGAVVGGGLALALTCDLRVASNEAYFASHFIRVGLSSCDLGTSYWLPRICGPTIAAELMLTGRRFSATEALEYGLLNRIVDDEALLATAVELAEAIAANSEYGVRMTKVGMWANLDASSLRAAMELENRTQVLGTFTGNMTEAGEAFREKRAPNWKSM
ncbi:MAG: enoyl-CoA hydratase-related protein [Acidimicrobiales bacterium]